VALVVAYSYEDCSVPLDAQSRSHQATTPVTFADGYGHSTAPATVPERAQTFARFRNRALDPGHLSQVSGPVFECMASARWQLANWCLHRSAWHESNASKHLILPCFVPHRKLPSLHDIGWAFHANTTTSATMRMVTDHAASDLDSPALPASLFHRLGQHVETCETLRTVVRAYFGSCR